MNVSDSDRMRLLITTQAVDQRDPVLGFFHRWLEVFAVQTESVEVICLREGEHALPANVRVHSLGKERGAVGSATYAWRLLRLAWRLRGDYDAVFVHMNPEYFVVAGGLWKLLGKPAALWYTHKSVDLKLRIAVFWTSVVFSASRESFRLPTKKLQVLGHGIDLAQFAPQTREPTPDGALRILTAGRISATKRTREMLDALDVLNANGVPFTFTVAGEPATEADRAYEEELKRAIAGRPYAARVTLLGPVAHADMPRLLARHDVFLNLSATGSMDKAVLEPLAAGVPAVTSNEAFRDLLAPSGLFVSSIEPETVAHALEAARTVDIAPAGAYVRAHYALDRTIAKIIEELGSRV